MMNKDRGVTRSHNIRKNNITGVNEQEKLGRDEVKYKYLMINDDISQMNKYRILIMLYPTRRGRRKFKLITSNHCWYFKYVITCES